MNLAKFSGTLAGCMLAAGIMLQQACKKQEADNQEPVDYLIVSFPTLVKVHDSYLRLPYGARVITMCFDKPVDTNSLKKALTFSDRNGVITSYKLVMSGATASLDLNEDFLLRDGWSYHLALGSSVTSLDGSVHLKGGSIEFRTSGLPFYLLQTFPGSDTARNAIAVISDIHLGNSRAVDGGYCWFGKNAAALESFLALVGESTQIRTLVIQGDLFDEWLVPFRLSPFDSAAGIRNSREFFLSVADAPMNQPIIQKLREIAAGGFTTLVYVPGNHDMLLTREVLEEINPGVFWSGDLPGLGKYSPAEGIVLEHGHRYDFFNCPQPLINQGHILPPGYFVTRLYAQGMNQARQGFFLKQPVIPKYSWAFLASWTLCFTEVCHQFNMNLPPMDSLIIPMSGIDGYLSMLSFKNAQDMYGDSIEPKWPATQAANGVPVPLPVYVALLNGVDIGAAAYQEYLNQTQSLNAYRIVSFGHSHNPYLQVYPPGQGYNRVYANSGSWVNADQTSHPVRTFLIIKPSAWTGSDLDEVMLYQYNKVAKSTSKDSAYVPELLAEENVPHP